MGKRERAEASIHDDFDNNDNSTTTTTTDSHATSEQEDRPVAYGKYARRYYTQVWRIDRLYCRWVARRGGSARARERLRPFAEWLLRHTDVLATTLNPDVRRRPQVLDEATDHPSLSAEKVAPANAPAPTSSDVCGGVCDGGGTPREDAVVLEFDGHCRGAPLVVGYGAIVRDLGGRRLCAKKWSVGGDAGRDPYSAVEYRGFLHALRFVLEDWLGGASELHIRGGSRIVVEQLNGHWRCRSENLKPLWREASAALAEARKKFGRVHIECVDTVDMEADALANAAIDDAADGTRFFSRIEKTERPVSRDDASEL